jgi:hypothetical protein
MVHKLDEPKFRHPGAGRGKARRIKKSLIPAFPGMTTLSWNDLKR